MAISMTYGEPNFATGIFGQYVAWVQAEAPTARISASAEQRRVNIMFDMGNMQYLELTQPQELIEMNPSMAQQQFRNWVAQNGIRLKVEEALEPVEIPKKKRIRMGKWGIAKEHING